MKFLGSVWEVFADLWEVWGRYVFGYFGRIWGSVWKVFGDVGRSFSGGFWEEKTLLFFGPRIRILDISSRFWG